MVVGVYLHRLQFGLADSCGGHRGREGRVLLGWGILFSHLQALEMSLVYVVLYVGREQYYTPTDRQTHRQTERLILHLHTCCAILDKRDRSTYGYTDRQTARHTDRYGSLECFSAERREGREGRGRERWGDEGRDDGL